jgi:hypothetical protein
VSELYPENLETLIKVTDALPDLSFIDGVFEVEVRVRVDAESDTWAVIGYGEAGDPCILRFEETVKPAPKPPLYTINNQVDKVVPIAPKYPPFGDNVWADGHTNQM